MPDATEHLDPDWTEVIPWLPVAEARREWDRWLLEHPLSDGNLERAVRVDIGRGLSGQDIMRALVRTRLLAARRWLIEDQPPFVWPWRAEVLAAAQAIVDGTTEPSAGASQIWAVLAERPESYPPDLAGFVGLASEWEDAPAYRKQYSEDIRELACETVERGRRDLNSLGYADPDTAPPLPGKDGAGPI